MEESALGPRPGQGTSMPHFKVKRGSASVSELTTFHMKYIGVKFLRFVSILQILFIYEYESHPFDTQRKINGSSAIWSQGPVSASFRLPLVP